MQFQPPPQISRRKIIAAGESLISANSTIEERSESRMIMNAWRASHAKIINTFQANLRAKIRDGSFGEKVIVSQRLKRAPTIIEKLKQNSELENDINLVNMQDIAGVRAIVPTISDVIRLKKIYLSKGRVRHSLKREKDYINEPKEDGYRSVHLIYKYINKSDSRWDGLLVELQIRTKLQHSWATAVESMHSFLGKSIKTRQGQERDKKWTDFFRLVSSAFAHIEKKPVTNEHRSYSKKKILDEIISAEKDLKVLEKLNAYNKAIKIIGTNKRGYYHLITLNTKEKSVEITSFKEDASIRANEAYEKAEQSTSDQDHIEHVLVSATAVEEAYPSFFSNTNEFYKNLTEVLDGAWVKSK